MWREEAVTYNFDAERWFEREREVLLRRRAAGELDDVALAEALQRLEQRVEGMEARLDGTFQVGPLAPRS